VITAAKIFGGRLKILKDLRIRIFSVQLLVIVHGKTAKFVVGLNLRIGKQE